MEEFVYIYFYSKLQIKATLIHKIRNTISLAFFKALDR